MNNPKYQIGDRVQVIMHGVVVVPDAHITFSFLLKKGTKIEYNRQPNCYPEIDMWAYMITPDKPEIARFEENIHPYPEDQLDPAYERMVRQINFSIGETAFATLESRMKRIGRPVNQPP